jgi:predicted metalloprotease with PDZ domain
MLCAASAFAQAQEPVRYQVRFPAPHTHYLEVEASIPAGKPQVELFLPVWTPGSYLVREYARNVEDFRASAAGKPLAWRKSRKNRWLVDAAGAPRITLNYRVYAHEPSVQGNWVDAGFAMLNGAPNFITVAGELKRPHEVTLTLPAAWAKSVSGMPNGPGGLHHYLAADYDTLVDSPIYAGNAAVHEFEAAAKRHFLVNEGETEVWDGPASARDVKQIVEEYARMWGGLPYEKYVFFNLLIESGGGLEHANSTWMNTSRWAYGNTAEPPPDPEATAGRGRRGSRWSWLGLVSHEYFHLWNVKRLRPVELGPFDYENEVYTRSLWIAEGFTSYYGPLALRRAGLTTREQFLRSMSGAIGQLQNTPGRLAQPVETASYDAWIKFYRPDENSPNTAISYYTKGDVVGLLLDAKVRRATGGARGLDDVMKLAYQRHAGERGYTPAEFRRAASDVAGSDLGPWFQRALETTEELDYTEMLDWFGLRFRPEPQRGGAAPRWNTGLTVRTDGGRLVVTQVRRGTPGYDAGLNVDDEILAAGDYRIRAEQWPARLDSYKPGTKVALLVARRDRLMRLELPLVAEKRESWTLEVRPDATEAQKANLKAWLRE